MQETTRKDVKQRLIWSVVIKMGYHKNLCNQWDLATVSNIVLGCVIMHNMIIEDEIKTPIWKSCMWPYQYPIVERLDIWCLSCPGHNQTWECEYL